jgi:hypothetical protein
VHPGTRRYFSQPSIVYPAANVPAGKFGFPRTHTSRREDRVNCI